jgi:hypothetical protein
MVGVSLIAIAENKSVETGGVIVNAVITCRIDRMPYGRGKTSAPPSRT